jgi:LmbE family N-acetylglucosaminyl deacetylase
VRRFLPALSIALVLVIAAAVWSFWHVPPDSRSAFALPRASDADLRGLTLSSNTRLLVVAPHPDDEVLAAGGVIQRVRDADWIVHVVYLTDGEGYPKGVKAERRHGQALTPSDYRAYGRQRQDEARAALRDLGYGAWSLTFLGFPNGGLNSMMAAYWSDREKPYQSKYTRLHRPRAAAAFIRDTEYRGEDLTQELAEIVGAFKPTLILTPRAEDQHVDHCAAWFFVADALADVERVHPKFRTDLVTYVVHHDAWPFDHPGMIFPFPQDLDSGVSGWINVALSPEQTMIKRQALHRYKSQMDVTPWFLDGFARANEVFSRPAPPHITLPVTNNPCDEFIER